MRQAVATIPVLEIAVRRLPEPGADDATVQRVNQIVTDVSDILVPTDGPRPWPQNVGRGDR